MATSEPRSTDSVQAVVTEAFAKTLGVQAVSLDDNFFELGGTSLSVALVLTDLEARLETEIPAAMFLEDPTPRGLAARLSAIIHP